MAGVPRMAFSEDQSPQQKLLCSLCSSPQPRVVLNKHLYSQHIPYQSKNRELICSYVKLLFNSVELKTISCTLTFLFRQKTPNFGYIEVLGYNFFYFNSHNFLKSSSKCYFTTKVVRKHGFWCYITSFFV